MVVQVEAEPAEVAAGGLHDLVRAEPRVLPEQRVLEEQPGEGGTVPAQEAATDLCPLTLTTHLMPHMAADTTLRVPVILCSARVRNPSS